MVPRSPFDINSRSDRERPTRPSDRVNSGAHAAAEREKLAFGAASDCSVNVMVTDVPEREVGTTHHQGALLGGGQQYRLRRRVGGTGAPNGIDWDEEIGLPREPTAQLQPQMQGIAAVHDGYDDKRDAIRMLVGSDVLDGSICHIDTADCGIGL